MNIFVLHSNPVIAAIMQCDKHVVKMCLETAQMLSTIAGGPYKPTHANHPCTLWAKQSKQNFMWLYRHGLALCNEYAARYGKQHKCLEVIKRIKIPQLEDTGQTPFALAMPEECKCENPVEAYRRYYHTKARFAEWNYTNTPDWWMIDKYVPFVRYE